jgi:hypothetical protein
MNQFNPKCHSVFGLPLEFSIADVPRPYQGVLSVLTDIAVTTLSSAVATACHGVQVIPTLETPVVTCTIELYKVVDAVDTLVKSWAVTERNAAALFAGNLEHVDLEGQSIKIKVVNPVGGKVSVGVRKTY